MYTVSGVQVLSVESSATKTGGTRFKVNLSNGTSPSTFDQASATKANQLQGQLVDVDVEQAGDKGQFLNFGDIRVSGAPAPVAQFTPVNFVPAGAAAAEGLPIAPAITPIQPLSGRDPKIEERITRMNVLGTSFDFIGQLYAGAGPETIEEARTAALALARDLYGIAFNGTQEAVQPLAGGTPVDVPQTPEAVVAQVQEVMAGAPVQVGAPASSAVAW